MTSFNTYQESTRYIPAKVYTIPTSQYIKENYDELTTKTETNSEPQKVKSYSSFQQRKDNFKKPHSKFSPYIKCKECCDFLKEIYELSEYIYLLRTKNKEESTFPFSLKEFIQKNELLALHKSSCIGQKVELPYIVFSRTNESINDEKNSLIEDCRLVLSWIKFIHDKNSITMQTKNEAENCVFRYKKKLEEFTE